MLSGWAMYYKLSQQKFTYAHVWLDCWTMYYQFSQQKKSTYAHVLYAHALNTSRASTHMNTYYCKSLFSYCMSYMFAHVVMWFDNNIRHCQCTLIYYIVFTFCSKANHNTSYLDSLTWCMSKFSKHHQSSFFFEFTIFCETKIVHAQYDSKWVKVNTKKVCGTAQSTQIAHTNLQSILHQLNQYEEELTLLESRAFIVSALQNLCDLII